MSFGFVKACAFCRHLLQKVCRRRGDWVCVIKWVNSTSRAGQIVAASSVSVSAVFDCAFPELFPAGSFDSIFSGLLGDACRSLCDQAVWYAHLFPAWKSKLAAALAETHFSGEKSLDRFTHIIFFFYTFMISPKTLQSLGPYRWWQARHKRFLLVSARHFHVQCPSSLYS